jgi:hypothetical protein
LWAEIDRRRHPDDGRHPASLEDDPAGPGRAEPNRTEPGRARISQTRREAGRALENVGTEKVSLPGKAGRRRVHQ